MVDSGEEARRGWSALSRGALGEQPDATKSERVRMIAAVVAGATVIVVTGADLALSLLHPTRSGPLSRFVMAATWTGVRVLGARMRTMSLIGYAGTSVMLAQITTWVLGMWVGFALIYAGHLDQLGFTSRVDSGRVGMIDALYLSGTALTTVGFGDMYAAADGLRLVTVAEAATGLAVFGAAVAYVLSVYPLVSEIRVVARLLSAVHDDVGAAEFVVHGGTSRMQTLQRDLIQIDESTQRFPVLYYFHADDPSASLAAAIRASSLVVLQLRFGLDERVVPHTRWHGQVLEATLTRVIEHVGQRFFGRPSRPGPVPSCSEVDRRIARLRHAAQQVTGVEVDQDFDCAQVANLLSRSNAFLVELERRHLYAHEPL